MNRQLIVTIVALASLALFAACSAAAPAAVDESAPAAEATEALAEEVVSTEAPAEEAPATEGESATYVVNPAASSIEWYGSKPIGASERGTVQISDGQLSFNGSELVEGTVVIDMTTIAPTSQTGNMLDMLTNHLKSDEFFGVETYPTATLVMKSAEPTDVENQYAVTADLTIKETTEELEFLADVVVSDGTLEGTADIVVDRAVYDVRYGSGAFFSDLGDDLISDEMEITVLLAANS
jgi:polyisoprenoid-binding protein YceI